ncbi:hypothetical protein [Spiroplasma endosymbiont of Amphibalanus improvisus]|uniref:hypothetical protein n=1 Tax=Spiroplasma endosymbiont of Amphibalanus improvisus TaxID=3066327 RepID=UPI00313BDCBE
MANDYSYQKIVRRRNNSDVKEIPLTKKEQELLVKSFTYKIINRSELKFVIKDCHIGYHLFHSAQDQRYWTKVIVFDEPFNVKKPVFNTKWLGNATVAYGFDTLEEVIEKTNKMMSFGITAKPPINDYLIDWDKKTERIYVDNEPKTYSFDEYLEFQKWFSKNKIRIMSKKKGVKYFEDLKESEKSPMLILRSKSQEPPQRPKPMAVLFEEKKYSKNFDYTDMTKKRYIIGFYIVNGGF